MFEALRNGQAAFLAGLGSCHGKSSDGIVSDLALSFAGKELIPLPAFFSDAQLSHIICTAQLSHAVCDPGMGDRAKRLGLIVCEPGAESTPGIEPAADASRIIFTSGYDRSAERRTFVGTADKCQRRSPRSSNGRERRGPLSFAATEFAITGADRGHLRAVVGRCGDPSATRLVRQFESRFDCDRGGTGKCDRNGASPGIARGLAARTAGAWTLWPSLTQIRRRRRRTSI